MSWSDRLNRAIAYIEDNLDAELTIDDVAHEACCSRFHFHRVFQASFGVTFGEYVRKRRFTLAAMDVVNSQTRIVDIALKFGYDSPNAFTRAFREVHGVNPSDARSSQVRLATHDRVSISSDTRGTEKMDYRIIDIPSFKIVGASKHFEFNDFVKNGQKFWKKYVASDEYKALCQLSEGRPGQISGAPLLTAYYPEEDGKRDEFLDVMGVEMETEDSVEPFECHVVPAGTYAEFECSYRGAMKANRYIYGEWFAATGSERDDEKPDVVSYFPMPFRHFSEMAVRWWIPIKT